MDASYKAVKDGMAFYVQPDQIGQYSELGFEIYKVQEIKVTNVAAEQESVRGASEGHGTVAKEDTANG